MIVVSEIGEQWSPQTEPAMQAEIEMIIIFGSVAAKQLTTIGIRMPKVPQDVPVANERPTAIRKMITGRNIRNPVAECSTSPATYSFAPRLSVMDFRVHANVRIRIGETICLKPSGTHSIIALNETMRRSR